MAAPLICNGWLGIARSPTLRREGMHCGTATVLVPRCVGKPVGGWICLALGSIDKMFPWCGVSHHTVTGTDFLVRRRIALLRAVSLHANSRAHGVLGVIVGILGFPPLGPLLDVQCTRAQLRSECGAPQGFGMLTWSVLAVG